MPTTIPNGNTPTRNNGSAARTAGRQSGRRDAPETSWHREKREYKAQRCRKTLTSVLAGLFVQFLFGMYLNLYVTHLHGQPPLIAHIVLGTALVIGGIAAFVFAVQSRRGDHILIAALGLAALGLAWTGGIRFLTAGGKSIDSYLMALGFVCAVAAFTLGLVMIYRRSVVHGKP